MYAGYVGRRNSSFAVPAPMVVEAVEVQPPAPTPKRTRRAGGRKRQESEGGAAAEAAAAKSAEDLERKHSETLKAMPVSQRGSL